MKDIEKYEKSSYRVKYDNISRNLKDILHKRSKISDLILKTNDEEEYLNLIRIYETYDKQIKQLLNL